MMRDKREGERRAESGGGDEQKIESLVVITNITYQFYLSSSGAEAYSQRRLYKQVIQGFFILSVERRFLVV